jgi:DNA mismatch repair ATPase MutS
MVVVESNTSLFNLGGPRYGRVTLFEQYAKLKACDPVAVVLLRDGSRYVAFSRDAQCVAHTLLLSESTVDGHPVTEFPCRDLARSLTALSKAGFRVTVLSDPLDFLVEFARGGRKVA